MKKFTFVIFKDSFSNVLGEYSVFANNEKDATTELNKYSFKGEFRLAMVS